MNKRDVAKKLRAMLAAEMQKLQAEFKESLSNPVAYRGRLYRIDARGELIRENIAELEG